MRWSWLMLVWWPNVILMNASFQVLDQHGATTNRVKEKGRDHVSKCLIYASTTYYILMMMATASKYNFPAYVLLIRKCKRKAMKITRHIEKLFNEYKMLKCYPYLNSECVLLLLVLLFASNFVVWCNVRKNNHGSGRVREQNQFGKQKIFICCSWMIVLTMHTLHIRTE